MPGLHIRRQIGETAKQRQGIVSLDAFGAAVVEQAVDAQPAQGIVGDVRSQLHALIVGPDDHGPTRFCRGVHHPRRQRLERQMPCQLRHRRQPQPIQDHVLIEMAQEMRRPAKHEKQSVQQHVAEQPQRRRAQMMATGKGKRKDDEAEQKIRVAQAAFKPQCQEPETAGQQERIDERSKKLQRPLARHRHADAAPGLRQSVCLIDWHRLSGNRR